MRKSMIDEATERLTAALETAQGMGAKAARLGFRQEEHIGCEFENGRLKNTDTRHNIAFYVEVLLDGRKAGASGNDLADVDEVISRAIALAKAGSVAHFEAYPAPGKVVEVKTHSPRTVELPREKLIEACQTVADSLKAYNPEMYIYASADRSESESILVTSGGVCREAKGTAWSLSSYVQRTEGTDMLFAGHERWGVEIDQHWDPNWIVERTLEDLRRGETIAEPKAGRTIAFLPPEIFRMLLDVLELGISGRNVAKGDSPLRGRLGERMLDRSLTIVDDPHKDFCCGARAVDDCGVPTRTIPIVTNGVLESFLYDLDSAGLAGVKPTGSIGCQPHSLTVPPGEVHSDELLAGIGDGVFIRQLMGFGQGNLINGDFSCNLGLGFRIRDGKVLGRLKDTMVTGNFYELFGDNVRLSSDADPIIRVPSAVIEGVSLTAASGG